MKRRWKENENWTFDAILGNTLANFCSFVQMKVTIWFQGKQSVLKKLSNSFFVVASNYNRNQISETFCQL